MFELPFVTALEDLWGNSDAGQAFDEALWNASGQERPSEASTESSKGLDLSLPTDDALTQLYKLAQNNPEYMELYLKLLAERENTANAQAWYEKLSNSQYQRAFQDLQKAGYNPYLALMGLSGAGSGSVSPAGTWSTSPYANKLQKEANQNQQKSSEAQMIRSIATIAGLAVTLIVALI